MIATGTAKSSKEDNMSGKDVERIKIKINSRSSIQEEFRARQLITNKAMILSEEKVGMKKISEKPTITDDYKKQKGNKTQLEMTKNIKGNDVHHVMVSYYHSNEILFML
jgi:hypothetical protein